MLQVQREATTQSNQEVRLDAANTQIFCQATTFQVAKYIELAARDKTKRLVLEETIVELQQAVANVDDQVCSVALTAYDKRHLMPTDL